MQVHAVTKNVPMSPQKVREVTRQIQGLPALQAQAVLAVVPRKSARMILKTLKSAIANAENNNKAKPAVRAIAAFARLRAVWRAIRSTIRMAAARARAKVAAAGSS